MQNPNLQEFLFSNVSDIKYAAENKSHSHPLPNDYTFQNILLFFWTSPSRDSFFPLRMADFGGCVVLRLLTTR